jgi:hypothetical protein
LRLATLLRGRSYYRQIATIDVRNHGQRIGTAYPQIKMLARRPRGPATEIIFGRFPHPQGDYNVPTRRKLAYLDRLAADHGGSLTALAESVDLRTDDLTLRPRRRVEQ